MFMREFYRFQILHNEGSPIDPIVKVRKVGYPGRKIYNIYAGYFLKFVQIKLAEQTDIFSLIVSTKCQKSHWLKR